MPSKWSIIEVHFSWKNCSNVYILSSTTYKKMPLASLKEIRILFITDIRISYIRNPDNTTSALLLTVVFITRLGWGNNDWPFTVIKRWWYYLTYNPTQCGIKSEKKKCNLGDASKFFLFHFTFSKWKCIFANISCTFFSFLSHSVP